MAPNNYSVQNVHQKTVFDYGAENMGCSRLVTVPMVNDFDWLVGGNFADRVMLDFD